jgi:hypothetical protein
MKKLKLLLLCLPFSLLANSQAGQINQINIVSFTVKNTLPGNIDSWLSTPGALMLVAQKVPNTRMMEPRLVLQIRSGGAVICGNNNSTAKQVDPFDVRTFNTAELTGLFGNCHELKEGSYTICAQFFNIDKIAISREVCKEFRVEATNIEYAPPTLITPDNGKKFTPQELQGPVMFRWTPLVPKPKEPVTYRLKVWQLMQGQSGTMAMRTNQPIVTKDVDNITQATVSGIYTGPCRPPYLCDFVWNVQALNRNGKPMGNNNGMSEPYTFGLAEEKGKCPANVFPEDKKKLNLREAITFRWAPTVPGESSTYRLKVWQLMQGQNGLQTMKTNQPIVTKDVADITEATVNGIWTGPCKPPYLCDYIWTVETMPAAGRTGCTSQPTYFSDDDDHTKCPTNLFPEDKKNLNPEQAKQAITFKWTKIETPGASSTYRLKVWQLMQGQNGSQAMRTNKPIVTKDVADITETKVSGIYTGPCRPPYLCDFIWAVEKISASGQVICSSEPTMFFVTQYIIQIDSIKVSCTSTPGVYSFKYCITNPNAGTAKLITLTTTSSVPAGATIGTFSPPLNTTINSNGQLCITGTINAASNLSNICIGAAIQDVANNFWQAQRDTCVTVQPCACDACDEKHFTLNAPAPQQVNYGNNQLSFNQPVNITITPTKTIKSIKAELVYFEMIPENDLCIPCNKDAATYGHFANGTNAEQWNGSQTNLNIKITTPQLTPCCSVLFKWCIRYKIEFTDCTTCNKLVCYEKKKEGCDNGLNH